MLEGDVKPAPFDYAKPATLEEALGLLDGHGEDARLLAGGQSLLPTLNMRLSAPAILVDISALEALRGLDAVPVAAACYPSTRYASSKPAMTAARAILVQGRPQSVSVAADS